MGAMLLLALITAACNAQQPAALEAAIQIIQPIEGAQFLVGDSIEVISTFGDPGGAEGVILQVDPGLTRQDDFTSPVAQGSVNQIWQPEAAGDYVMQVFLSTSDGQKIGSARVQVRVGEVVETPSPTPAESTPTPTTIPPTVIARQDANCRLGPGLSFQVVATIDGGHSASVTGRLANELWWQVADQDGVSCWVFAENVATLGDFSGVPVLASPPTPTPTPTPTSTPVAPSAPTALSPSGSVGCVSSVFLTWTAVSHTDGIDHYEWAVSGAASDSGSTSDTQVEFIVSCGNSYQWRVRAVAVGGAFGAWSSTLSFDTN